MAWRRILPIETCEYHNANQWVLVVFIQMVKFESWRASENAFHSLSVTSRNSPLKWIANMRTKYYRTVRKCYCFYLLWQYYYYWFAHLQQKCFFVNGFGWGMFLWASQSIWIPSESFSKLLKCDTKTKLFWAWSEGNISSHFQLPLNSSPEKNEVKLKQPLTVMP